MLPPSAEHGARRIAALPWLVALDPERLMDSAAPGAALLTFMPAGTHVQLLRPSQRVYSIRGGERWMAFVQIGSFAADIVGNHGWIYVDTGSFARVHVEVVEAARPKASGPGQPPRAAAADTVLSLPWRLPAPPGVATYGRTPRGEPPAVSVAERAAQETWMQGVSAPAIGTQRLFQEGVSDSLGLYQ